METFLAILQSENILTVVVRTPLSTAKWVLRPTETKTASLLLIVVDNMVSLFSVRGEIESTTMIHSYFH